MTALAVGLAGCAAGGNEQLRAPLESAKSSVASSQLGLTLYSDGELPWPEATTLLGDMTRDLRDAATTVAESGAGADHATYLAAVTAVRDAADAVASTHATLKQHPDAPIAELETRLEQVTEALKDALRLLGGAS